MLLEDNGEELLTPLKQQSTLRAGCEHFQHACQVHAALVAVQVDGVVGSSLGTWCLEVEPHWLLWHCVLVQSGLGYTAGVPAHCEHDQGPTCAPIHLVPGRIQLPACWHSQVCAPLCVVCMRLCALFCVLLCAPHLIASCAGLGSMECSWPHPSCPEAASWPSVCVDAQPRELITCSLPEYLHWQCVPLGQEARLLACFPSRGRQQLSCPCGVGFLCLFLAGPHLPLDCCWFQHTHLELSFSCFASHLTLTTGTPFFRLLVTPAVAPACLPSCHCHACCALEGCSWSVSHLTDWSSVAGGTSASSFLHSSGISGFGVQAAGGLWVLIFGHTHRVW